KALRGNGSLHLLKRLIAGNLPSREPEDADDAERQRRRQHASGFPALSFLGTRGRGLIKEIVERIAVVLEQKDLAAPPRPPLCAIAGSLRRRACTSEGRSARRAPLRRLDRQVVKASHQRGDLFRRC